MGYLVNATTYRLGYCLLWTDDWFVFRGGSSVMFQNVLFLRMLFKFCFSNFNLAKLRFSINDLRIVLMGRSIFLQVFFIEYNRGELFFNAFFRKLFVFLGRRGVRYWKWFFQFFYLKQKRIDFWSFQITGGQFFVYFFCLFLGKFFDESLFLYFIFPIFFCLSLGSTKVGFFDFFFLALFILRLFNVSSKVIMGVLILRFLFVRFFKFFPYLVSLFNVVLMPFESRDPIHYILNERLRRFFFCLFKVIVRWFFRLYWFVCFYRSIFWSFQLEFCNLVSKLCFFPVFLVFFFSGFCEVSVRYIGSWLVHRLSLAENWNVAIRSVQGELYHLMKMSIIYGFKLQFSGRFTRRQRSVLCWKLVGRVPFSSKLAYLDYFSAPVNLSNGVGCVKVWLYRNFEVGDASLRVSIYEAI